MAALSAAEEAELEAELAALSDSESCATLGGTKSVASEVSAVAPFTSSALLADSDSDGDSDGDSDNAREDNAALVALAQRWDARSDALAAAAQAGAGALMTRLDAALEAAHERPAIAAPAPNTERGSDQEDAGLEGGEGDGVDAALQEVLQARVESEMATARAAVKALAARAVAEAKEEATSNSYIDADAPHTVAEGCAEEAEVSNATSAVEALAKERASRARREAAEGAEREAQQRKQAEERSEAEARAREELEHANAAAVAQAEEAAKELEAALEAERQRLREEAAEEKQRLEAEAEAAKRRQLEREERERMFEAAAAERDAARRRREQAREVAAAADARRVLAASKLARAYRRHLRGPQWSARRAAVLLLQRWWRGFLARAEAGRRRRRRDAMTALRAAVGSALRRIDAARTGTVLDSESGGDNGGDAKADSTPSVQALIVGAEAADCGAGELAALRRQCTDAADEVAAALQQLASQGNLEEFGRHIAAAGVLIAYRAVGEGALREFKAVVCAAESTMGARRRGALEALAAAAGSSASVAEVASLASKALALGVPAEEVDTLRASAAVRDERVRSQLAAAAKSGSEVEVRSLCAQAARLGLIAEATAAEAALELRRREAMDALRDAASNGGKARYDATRAAAGELGCNVDALARVARAFEERQRNARRGVALALVEAAAAGGEDEDDDGDVPDAAAHGSAVEVLVAQLRGLGMERDARNAESELDELRSDAEKALRAASRSGSANAAALAMRKAQALGLTGAVESARATLSDRSASAQKALEGCCAQLLEAVVGEQALLAAESSLRKAQERGRALGLDAQADAADDAVRVARAALATSSMPSVAATAALDAFGMPHSAMNCHDDARGLLLGKVQQVSLPLFEETVVAEQPPASALVPPEPAEAFVRYAAGRARLTKDRAAARRQPSPALVAAAAAQAAPPAATQTSTKKGANAPSSGEELTAATLVHAAGGAAAVASAMALDLGLEALGGVEALRQCTRLESLILNVNMLTSEALGGLRHCESLRELSLKDNRVTSAAPLAALANLQVLCLDNNQMRGLDGLCSLPNLRLLSIASNRLTSLAGLERCGSLERLSAAGNALESLEGCRLDKLRRLQHLDLSRNRLCALDGAHLPAMLTWLDASYNAIRAWPARLTQPLLATLRLVHNKLEGVLELAPMPRLECLFVQDNAVVGIAGAGDCPSLRTLDASFNAIEERWQLARLAACPSLRVLHLNDNPIAAALGYKADAMVLLPRVVELDSELLPVRSGGATRRRGVPDSADSTDDAPRWYEAASAHWRATTFVGVCESQSAELVRAAGAAATTVSWAALEGLSTLSVAAAECAAVRELAHVQCRMLSGDGSDAIGGVRFDDLEAAAVSCVAFDRRIKRARARAASTVQRAWRGVLAHRRRLDGAAATIQAHWRGRRTRKSEALRALKRAAVARAAAAASRIQAMVRGRAVRRRMTAALEAARFVDEDEFDYGEVNESMYMPPEDFDFGPPPAEEGAAHVPPLVPILGLPPSASVPQEQSAISAISARAMTAASEVIRAAEVGAMIDSGVAERRRQVEEARSRAEAWVHGNGAPAVQAAAAGNGAAAAAAAVAAAATAERNTSPHVEDSDPSLGHRSASRSEVLGAGGASRAELTPRRLAEGFGALGLTEAYQQRQRSLASKREKKIEAAQQEWGFTNAATAEAFYRAQARRTRAQKAVAKREKLADPTKRLERFKRVAVPQEHVVNAPRGGVSTQRGVHGPSVHLGNAAVGGEDVASTQQLLTHRSDISHAFARDDVSDISLASQRSGGGGGSAVSQGSLPPARTINNWTAGAQAGGAPVLVMPRRRRGGRQGWK